MEIYIINKADIKKRSIGDLQKKLKISFLLYTVSRCSHIKRHQINITALALSVFIFVGSSFALFLGMFFSSLLFSNNAQAETFYIEDANISGNRRIDSTAIRMQLKHTKGQISNTDISEDVKTLYKTGFFDQVSAALHTLDNGRQVVVYTVVEKPTVRKVYIRGNKGVKEGDLTPILTFGPKRFLDRGKLDSMGRAAESLYQSRGFYDAKVTSSVVPVDEGQVDVTFTVAENERFKIKRVAFRGVNNIDPDALRKVIETKRYKWWNSWLLGTGRLNHDMLENDKGLIRQYFLDHGYVEATLSDPRVERVSDGELAIVFDIFEGPQYKIGKVTASGDLVNKSVEKTLDGVKASSGDLFSASEIRNDSFTVSQKFSDEGFAFVNVNPVTDIDKDLRVVNLDYSISKGKKVAVNRINIRGNQRTYDNVIRREMKIGEQEQFSSSKVQRSETLLKRLGYFEEVNITAEPTDRDDQVNLGVNVKEAPTGTFTVGAGYSSSDGTILNGRVTENNVLGTGRRLDLNLDWGTQRSNFILGFTDPRVNDTHLSLGVDADISERELLDFRQKTAGGGLSSAYPLDEIFGESFEDISATGRYDYSSIDISDIEDDAAQLIKDAEGKSTASSITPGFFRNTIDNPLNPTKGSRQILTYEIAGAGGDEKYTLLSARNQWYYPAIDSEAGPYVFSLRTRLDYGESTDDDPFPVFRRFFPGGINSVRGYDSRTLGPKDSNGALFGGSKQFVNNAEVIFPLVNAAGLRGVVFYDAGEAFDDDRSIDLGELRTAYGFGIRWFSPIGPIRFEVGFPADKEEGDDSVVYNFAFGAPL